MSISMKKMLMVAVAVLGICTVHAKSLVPDPCNYRFHKPTNTPLNWYIQANAAEKANTTYNELGENKRVIKFAPKKYQIQFYYGSAINVMKGDQIKVTVKAKGTGVFKIGYFAYKAKGANSFTELIPLELTDKEQTFEKTITVRDNEAGEKTEVIRLVMQTMPGAVVEVIGYSAEMVE